MSKENTTLSERLINLVIDANEEAMNFIDNIISEINDRMLKNANYGLTTFVIQFNKNADLIPENSDMTIGIISRHDKIKNGIQIFTANEVIKRKYADYIKDYYVKQGLYIHDYDGVLLTLSWNQNILNHYGY